MAATQAAAIGVLLAFLSASLGYGGGILEGALPTSLTAWGCFAAAALVVGGASGFAMGRRAQASGAQLAALQAAVARVPGLEEQVEARRAKLRQIRHDIRGALSPALLASDRLLAQSDPTVRRSAEIVVRSVDRAIVLLADTPEASPPGGL